jgi:DNA repair photolyase
MIREIEVKSVLNRKKKRDSWFLDEYTLNPYEGCSFNCLYCYIRGSKYGENMEGSVTIKTNALTVLDKQLAFRVKKNQYGIIAVASATDPYMHADDTHLLTRNCLHVIRRHRFPVLIITKSTGVLRDLDILRDIDRDAVLPEDLKPGLSRGVILSFSFSTLDESLAKKLEPGAPSPRQRLETMRQCKANGFLTGVNCIPTLPFLSDSEEKLEEMIVTAKEYGADYILIGGLTLFGDGQADSKTLYYKFLERLDRRYVVDYRRLYLGFSYPPRDYVESLSEKATRLCRKHQIRNRILSD